MQQEEQTRRQLAELANALHDKQKALQAAQEDLKKQQAEVALKTLRAAGASTSDEKNALKAEWEKLTLATKDLNERQKALDTAHQTLKQEQSKTSQNVSAVQTVLDGIRSADDRRPQFLDDASWGGSGAATAILPDCRSIL